MLTIVLSVMWNVPVSYAFNRHKNLHFEITNEGTVVIPLDGQRKVYPEIALGPEILVEISSRIFWRLSLDLVLSFEQETSFGVLAFTSFEYNLYKNLSVGIGADTMVEVIPSLKWTGSIGPLIRLKINDSSHSSLRIKGVGFLLAVSKEQPLSGDHTDVSNHLSYFSQNPLEDWLLKFSLQISWGL